ncbi:MAG: NeuD/PglB/VioB family sugar acetyltransferase [Bacteroidetes bacterium]|nr:NeuD/PglB/VioB family sugar acetyltransferase [Bacteroidota bacterium]
MKRKDIILIGGGGHCCSCIDVIEQEGKYNIAGIVDTQSKIGESVLGHKIIAGDKDLPKLVKEHSIFFITIGQIGKPEARKKVFHALNGLDVFLPTIISPIAYVSKHAKVGRGTIIMHHAIINAGVLIGHNCIINTKALVEHDAIVGDFCHISTNATINGGVKVENDTFIGSGAVTKENVVIREGSFIKANSIVK